jgi:hypothetical protein
MGNRRTRSSKIQKVDEDSDFDLDQDFGPSPESVPSEGEQQRKYAFDCVSESTPVIHLITFLSGLSQSLKVSS